MTAVRQMVKQGGYERLVSPGDLILSGEQIATLTTAGAGTLTAALLVQSILSRTGPTGAVSDTTDTASNIINALLSSTFLGTGATTPTGVQPGVSWRLRYLNNVAYLITLVAGTGVTLAGTTTVPVSGWKDFLFQITNGSVGQLVTGTGIAASSKVISIQPGVGVTLSDATTVAGSLVSLTFAPTVTITGLGSGLIA